MTDKAIKARFSTRPKPVFLLGVGGGEGGSSIIAYFFSLGVHLKTVGNYETGCVSKKQIYCSDLLCLTIETNIIFQIRGGGHNLICTYIEYISSIYNPPPLFGFQAIPLVFNNWTKIFNYLCRSIN